MMRFLADMKVRTKLFGVAAVIFLILCGLLWVQISSNIHRRINVEKMRSDEFVAFAQKLVAIYKDEVDIGRLSEEEAKKLALDRLAKEKFRKGAGYFWVMDTQMNMLMHPTMPELVGKNVASWTDPSGEKLFPKFLEAGKSSEKGGSIVYNWPRPGQKGFEPKIANVQIYKPWNWVISTGFYPEKLKSEIYTSLHTVTAISIGAILLVSVLLLLISRSITKPLQQVTESLKSVASGNHAEIKKLDIVAKNEIGVLAFWFNEFVERMELTIAGITEVSEDVKVLVGDASKTSEVVRSANQAQQKVLHTTAESVKNIAASIQAIVSDANQLAEASKLANTSAKRASGVSSQVSDASAQLETFSEKTFSLVHGMLLTLERLNENVMQLNELADETSKVSSDISGTMDSVDTEMRRHSRFASRTRDELEEIAQEQLPEVENAMRQSINDANSAFRSLHTIYAQVNASPLVTDELTLRELNNAGNFMKQIRERLDRGHYPMKRIQESVEEIARQSAESVNLSVKLEKAFVSSLLNIETNASSVKKILAMVTSFRDVLSDQRTDLGTIVGNVKRVNELSQTLKKATIDQDRDSHEISAAVDEIASISTVILEETSNQEREATGINQTLSRSVEFLKQNKRAEEELLQIVQSLEETAKILTNRVLRANEETGEALVAAVEPEEIFIPATATMPETEKDDTVTDNFFGDAK